MQFASILLILIPMQYMKPWILSMMQWHWLLSELQNHCYHTTRQARFGSFNRQCKAIPIWSLVAITSLRPGKLGLLFCISARFLWTCRLNCMSSKQCHAHLFVEHLLVMNNEWTTRPHANRESGWYETIDLVCLALWLACRWNLKRNITWLHNLCPSSQLTSHLTKLRLQRPKQSE